MRATLKANKQHIFYVFMPPDCIILAKRTQCRLPPHLQNPRPAEEIKAHRHGFGRHAEHRSGLALEAIKLKLSVPSGDKVALLDTAANVEALNAAQITALPGIGVTGVSVSDANNVTLTVAQVAAFETSKVGLSIQSGQQVVLADTAANIAALTTTQIAGLNALHVTQIQAADTTRRRIRANIATLSAVQIGLLATTGFSGLTSTSGGVTLSLAQAQALE